ncbi:MAG: AMP-binding protein, partial [Thermodesulfobacteriota bacterium]|nr:AMP-binding protein [Thermodesulfobacteriota bacterium]
QINYYFSVDPGINGYIYLGELINKYPKDDPKVELTEDDLLFFQYTSGTTGLPKGAIHTQGTASAIIELSRLADTGLLTESSRALHVVPLYSFAGTAFDLIYQWRGALTVIMQKFDVTEMMRLIEKYKITDCHIVPVILNFMLNSPDFGKYDLSSLKCLTYGGAPMSPELLRAGIEKIGPVFMQDYGASEAGALTYLYIEDHVLDGPPEEVKRLASCGKPIPGADVKVLNDKGEEVKPGEIGELTVKSPANMKGYWKMPEETKEALRDGRFYTGDLCTVDEEGYIYVKDRKKDMIISGGMNIYPYEIESVLLEHPAILDAAVIGIPDDTWGEAVCALVVFKEEKKATEEEIIEHVRSKLASYKKPKKVEVVDVIPRTLSGKILKKDLRRKYWEGRDRKV